jgi:hypothetical protein
MVVVAHSTATPVGLNDTLSVTFFTVVIVYLSLKFLPVVAFDLTCPTTLIIAGLVGVTINLSAVVENIFQPDPT